MSIANKALAASKDATVLRVLILEGLVNLLVLVMKLVAGISSGSMAILGDAIHLLTNAANNIVAAVVVRMFAKPADREHPCGHKKFETLAVFGLSTLSHAIADAIEHLLADRFDVDDVSIHVEPAHR